MTETLDLSNNYGQLPFRIDEIPITAFNASTGQFESGLIPIDTAIGYVLNNLTPEIKGSVLVLNASKACAPLAYRFRFSSGLTNLARGKYTDIIVNDIRISPELMTVTTTTTSAARRWSPAFNYTPFADYRSFSDLTSRSILKSIYNNSRYNLPWLYNDIPGNNPSDIFSVFSSCGYVNASPGGINAFLQQAFVIVASWL